jgi:glycosyltransferase involved in cell wall biosynthesis
VGSSRHKIGFDVLLFERAFRAMFAVRPDVIHAHLHEGALIGEVLSRMWGVPMVFDFQGSLTGEMVDHKFLSPQGRWYQPMLKLERLIDRQAPHILTSSAHAVNLLTSQFAVPAERVTYVPDCVNTDEFVPAGSQHERAALRRTLGVPPESTVIVYLGLLAEYQGTDHLLQAVADIRKRRKDVHLLIGGYPNVDHYRAMAHDLGLGDGVTFTGKVNYENAPRFLAAGDIAVSPKLSKTEGVGKVLNYMAVGLPTVSYDTEASREYVGQDGVYARRGDVADLARCLEELAADPGRRTHLGAALRRRARSRYSWDAAALSIMDIYASLMRPTPAVVSS